MTKSYSVLMSVYYKEKPEYLKEAIESVLNQTVKTDDFVIVCDGPLNEGLDKVIADFVITNPGLFNVFRLYKNMGLAKALNNGILQCKNEIIMRMDSDDVSRSDRAEIQLEAMEENNASIVGSNIIEFVDSIENTSDERCVPKMHKDIVEFAKKRSPFNHPSVMYKRQAVIDSGFYEDYRFFEDYNLWATMLSKGFVGHNVQDDLVYMRAGLDMYKRRGGLKYVKYIFSFNKRLSELGFISKGRYILSSTERAMVSLFPNSLRKAIYKKLLRK